jgi:outer membrane protein
MKRTFLPFQTHPQRGALLLAVLLLAGAPARAEGPKATLNAQSLTPPPAAAPALEIRDNAIQLSLDQAIALAVERNLGIVVQRYTRVQNRLGIDQSLGIYDLLLNADALANNTNSPTLSSIAASRSEEEDLDASLAQLLPTGGTFSLGWRNSRSKTNSPVFTVPTSFSSGLTFAYSQPLLRNYGAAATERGLRIARSNSQLGGIEFQRQVILLTQQASNAYWALVNAREQLVVAQQSLQLARDLNERNRIQVEVGTMAPLEVTQSEASIATREEGIIQATANIGDAEDTLRQLLNLPSGPLWRTPIIPTTTPNTDEKISANLDEALSTAIAQRPELRNQTVQLEQARLDAEYFRGQLKPRLDLNLSYGYSGVGTQYNNAFNQITGLDFRGWSAQLQFAYPIQNRTARAQSAIANIDVDRFQTLYDQERQVIETEVRRAARGVDTAAKAIDAARKAREFQEKNLDAEKKRYENGMSTSFQITQIQDQLTQARSNEVAATINYRTALTEYYRATGRLLDREGISIEDPGEPDYTTQRFSFRRGLLPGERR